MNESHDEPQKAHPKIPRTVWVLGIVSFFMNSASVIITALTPFFIMQVLGGSVEAVGHIRGWSESLSYVIKLFSGVISDYMGKRKTLILIGYGCAAITKPLFGIVKDIYQYTFIQVAERVANGLRDSPRDALIADCVPKQLKGTSYGIRQSFAMAGSMGGAFVCFFMLSHLSVGSSSDSVRFVYFLATIPSIIAVLMLYFGIKEKPGLTKLKDRKGFPIKKEDLKQLGGRFWYFMAIIMVFMSSRFSDAFLVVRAQEMGWDLSHMPLALAVMYLANSITAKVAGSLSDKIDRRVFLGLGFLFMIMTCLVLGIASTTSWLVIGTMLYGVHFGLTQGTFYALVADYSPPQIKGTSFGVFNLICALGMIGSNSVVGRLWNVYGAEQAMYVASAVAFVAFIMLLFLKKPAER